MNDETAMTDAEITDAAEAARLVSEELMAELVRLRKKRKLSQQPVAEAMGISQARVSQMENRKGGLALETVMNYARAIGANIVVTMEKPTPPKQ